MNGNLQRVTNVKGMLKRREDKIPSNENKEKFRIQNNYVTSLKRSSLKKYIDIRCFSDNYRRNPGYFWSNIEPLFNDNSKSNSHINLKEGGWLYNQQCENT